MSVQLKAGQKVRIGGLEFTVQNSDSKIYNKKRITELRLEAIEDLSTEDVADVFQTDSDAPTVEQAIDSLTQVFKNWGISLEDFVK